MTTHEIGHVVGTKEHAELDGSQMIQVEFSDCVREVRIDREHVATLLIRLQSVAMAQAHETAQDLTLPVLKAIEIGLAHQGREVALLVSTAQMGSLVIELTDDQSETLKSELDRMKTYLSAPPNPQ